MYGAELEKVEVFSGFQDFVETFNIHRGKVKSKSDEEDTTVGEFKVKKEESPFIFLVICHQSVARDTFLDRLGSGVLWFVTQLPQPAIFNAQITIEKQGSCFPVRANLVLLYKHKKEL